VDDDDSRLVRDLAEREPHRLAPRRAPGHAGVHLSAPELLGEQDRRFLPVRWSRDHDRLDPVGCLEPLQALGQQRPVAEANERLWAVGAEPFPTTGRSEDGRYHRAL
jgi:hypothetical protein